LVKFRIIWGGGSGNGSCAAAQRYYTHTLRLSVQCV